MTACVPYWVRLVSLLIGIPEDEGTAAFFYGGISQYHGSER